VSLKQIDCPTRATIQHYITVGTKNLQLKTDSPRLDSELLLSFVLNKPREYLYTWPERSLNHAQQNAFNTLIQKRSMGHPIAYLLGNKEFWSRTFKVNSDTLIPRPQTETLIEIAIELFPKHAPLRILDLGTGCGIIAITLAKHFKNATLLATDIEMPTLQVAKHNANSHQVPVSFIRSKWFSALEPQLFDLIISNPPYIDEQDPHLNLGDVRFEPPTALIAKKAGLADLDAILTDAKKYLNNTGCILLEHGYNQATSVKQLMHAKDYQNIQQYKDLDQQDRCSLGYYKSI